MSFVRVISVFFPACLGCVCSTWFRSFFLFTDGKPATISRCRVRVNVRWFERDRVKFSQSALVSN